MRITLVRHGITKLNKQNVFQGITNEPLDEEGFEQAKKVAQRLKNEKFTAIYSSPLSRALETAKAIHEFHKEVPLKTDERLIETHFGIWEGKSLEEVKRKYPEMYEQRMKDKFNFKIPGGESYAETKEIIGDFLESIEKTGHILIVAHGAIIRTFLQNLFPEKDPNFVSHLRINNTAVTTYYLEDGEYKEHLLNCTKHLE